MTNTNNQDNVSQTMAFGRLLRARTVSLIESSFLFLSFTKCSIATALLLIYSGAVFPQLPKSDILKYTGSPYPIMEMPIWPSQDCPKTVSRYAENKYFKDLTEKEQELCLKETAQLFRNWLENRAINALLAAMKSVLVSYSRMASSQSMLREVYDRLAEQGCSTKAQNREAYAHYVLSKDLFQAWREQLYFLSELLYKEGDVLLNASKPSEWRIHEPKSATPIATLRGRSMEDPWELELLVAIDQKLETKSRVLEWKSRDKTTSLPRVKVIEPLPPIWRELRVASELSTFDWTAKLMVGQWDEYQLKSKTYRLPDGYEYCSHTDRVYSQKKASYPKIRGTNRSVTVEAWLSGDGWGGRGWYKTNLKIKALPDTADACEFRAHNCSQLMGPSTPPPDGEYDCYAGSSCERGILLCKRGVESGGHCREPFIVQPCGFCSGSNF